LAQFSTLDQAFFTSPILLLISRLFQTVSMMVFEISWTRPDKRTNNSRKVVDLNRLWMPLRSASHCREGDRQVAEVDTCDTRWIWICQSWSLCVRRYNPWDESIIRNAGECKHYFLDLFQRRVYEGGHL
jgi:hypothetical protein